VKWIGYDEGKAKKNIRAVANELQGNVKIIEDFGQLYFDDSLKKRENAESEKFAAFSIALAVDISLPDIYVFGVAYKLTEQLTVEADIVRTQWSTYNIKLLLRPLLAIDL
jgi:Long-chain fatty acid transport protein